MQPQFPIRLGTLDNRNLVGLLVGKVLVRGSGILITLLLPRFWDADQYGAFAAVFSLVLLLEALAPAGQHYVILRETARDPSTIRSSLRRAWRAAALPTAALSTVLILTLVNSESVTQPTTGLLAGSAFLLVLRTPLWLHQAYFQGMEQSAPIVLGATLDSVVKLIGLGMVLAFSLGITGMILVLALGRLSSASFLIHATISDIRIRKAPGGTRAPTAVDPARMQGTGDFWVDPLLEFDIHFPQFIVAASFSAAAAAHFKIAAALVTLATMLGYALNEALIPSFARSAASDSKDLPDQLGMSCALNSLAGLAAGMLLAAASPLVPVVFGEEYRPAIGLILLLAAVLPLRFWALALGNSFLAKGATEAWSSALGLGAIAVMLVALATIPRYGAWGGAACICAAQLAQVAYLVIRTKRADPQFSMMSFVRFSALIRRGTAAD